MFCANCGSDVTDDVVFCPNCGKSAKGDSNPDVSVKMTDQVDAGGILGFTKNAFRGFMGFILWINLIVFAVGGGIGGYWLGRLINYREGGGTGAFLGVIIGIVVGLMVDVILGGFVATIINIDVNIKNINNDIIELKNKSK
jgi:hypothetical protein